MSVPSRAGRPSPFQRRLLCGVATLLLLSLGCAEDPEVRRGSIYDLRRDPTPENVAKIRAFLDDPDRDIRATALNTLVGMGVDDAEELALAGVKDEDGFVRSIATKRLGDLGNRENSELVATILTTDTDPRARRTAAQALEALAGDAAADGLILGLDDPMKDVRLAAVTGLRRIDPARGKEKLARLLLEDATWEVRVQAAGALGATGDRAMIPILNTAVTGDEVELVQDAARNAVARIEVLSSGGGAAPPSRDAAGGGG